MVCYKIMITNKKINQGDLSIFLKGGAALDKSDYRPKPNADWLTEKMWINILALSLHSFTNEGINFYKNLPD